MEYIITMERTQRIAVSYRADSDDAARRKASEIYDNTKPEDFESGTAEEDYAVDSEDGRVIEAWN